MYLALFKGWNIYSIAYVSFSLNTILAKFTLNRDNQLTSNYYDIFYILIHVGQIQITWLVKVCLMLSYNYRITEILRYMHICMNKKKHSKSNRTGASAKLNEMYCHLLSFLKISFSLIYREVQSIFECAIHHLTCLIKMLHFTMCKIGIISCGCFKKDASYLQIPMLEIVGKPWIYVKKYSKPNGLVEIGAGTKLNELYCITVNFCHFFVISKN